MVGREFGQKPPPLALLLKRILAQYPGRGTNFKGLYLLVQVVYRNQNVFDLSDFRSWYRMQTMPEPLK